MGLFSSKPKSDDQAMARQQIKINEGRDARAQQQLDAQQSKKKGFWS